MKTTTWLASIAGLWAAVGMLSPAAAEPPRELARWFTPQPWERDTAGPIVSLGPAGDFDDMHVFAPAVTEEQGRFQLWYCGSRGARTNRVFRLGLATSTDGKRFEKYRDNPVLQFSDGAHSVLTPTLLRQGDGTVLREDGKLRMWFCSAALGKSALHTLHETSGTDGIQWAEPSRALLENVYCPTVLKTEQGYQMWYSDVSKRPWVLRHATSSDGRKWTVTERPVLHLSQEWEAEVLVYPTVLQMDGVYLMWYGSYYAAVRRERTAIGFAASLDGLTWYKHPHNPVLRPDPRRPWEPNYVGSGCVLRLADGSFRYWYASRKEPPFLNLYFALNTARWAGPAVATKQPFVRLPLPPKKGDVGIFEMAEARRTQTVDVLEVVGPKDAILRAWYVPGVPPASGPIAAEDTTFVDLWVHGIDTRGLAAGSPAQLPQVFQVTGNKLFDTTCGQRSLPLLEPVDIERYR